MGFLDYLILAAILVLAVFAVRYALKHRNKCCGDCSNCSQCQSCNREEKK